jgi:heat shock protein HslJ
MDGLWRRKGGRLLVTALLVGLAVVALAVLIPDRETADLGGTAWTLVAYGPTDAPIAAEAPARIAFEANGRFSGSTGCNQFSGNYRAAGGRLEFVDNEVAMTLADCPAETPEGQQNTFFRAHLRSGIPYSETADRLTLHFADGQIAEYVRAQ